MFSQDVRVDPIIPEAGTPIPPLRKCGQVTLARRIDAVLLEEVGHRGPGDSVTEILEGTLDSGVAPVRILPSHPYSIVDDGLLVPIDPAGRRDDEQLPGA